MKTELKHNPRIWTLTISDISEEDLLAAERKLNEVYPKSGVYNGLGQLLFEVLKAIQIERAIGQ